MKINQTRASELLEKNGRTAHVAFLIAEKFLKEIEQAYNEAGYRLTAQTIVNRKCNRQWSALEYADTKNKSFASIEKDFNECIQILIDFALCDEVDIAQGIFPNGIEFK